MRTIVPKKSVTIPNHAERVFKGIVYDVYQWQQQLFDGTTTTFEMLKRADTVKVLAIKDEKLVVLQQEQPNQKPFFDIPGGAHDQENETELQAAQRELLEETGMTFSSWRLLSIVQPNRKIEQFVYTFLATGIESSAAGSFDPGEKITVQLLPLEDAKETLSSPQARFFPTDLKGIESMQDLINTRNYEE